MLDEVKLAGGDVDLSALSAENPIVIPISYEGEVNEESSDTTVPGDEDCTFTLAQDGMEWACNAPIDLYISGNGGSSNGGTDNYYECYTEGSLGSNQPGYETWDNYSFVVSINNETIASGLYGQDEIFQFDLPDDVVNETIRTSSFRATSLAISVSTTSR
jgi:hypothetical protein